MVEIGTSKAGQEDAFRNVQREIDDVRGIMTENIERVLERGERIDLLVDKTDRLGGSARDFRMRSKNLRRRMFWKNIRLMVLLGVVCVFLLYLLVGFGCGLPGKSSSASWLFSLMRTAWSRCIRHWTSFLFLDYIYPDTIFRSLYSTLTQCRPHTIIHISYAVYQSLGWFISIAPSHFSLLHLNHIFLSFTSYCTFSFESITPVQIFFSPLRSWPRQESVNLYKPVSTAPKAFNSLMYTILPALLYLSFLWHDFFHRPSRSLFSVTSISGPFVSNPSIIRISSSTTSFYFHQPYSTSIDTCVWLEHLVIPQLQWIILSI